MLEARNCNVTINQTGIMAQSVTVNSSNSNVAIKSLGKKGFSKYVPSGPVTHTVSLDYTLKTEKEPNYQIYNTIKSYINSSSFSPVTIQVGGISGSFYLESYSVSSSPNNLTTAKANYVSFEESLSGYLNDEKRENYFILTTESGEDIVTEDGVSTIITEGSLDYVGDYNGFANGWTTYFYENEVATSNDVYDFNYSFQTNWQPTYLIGRKTPSQVDMISFQESISVIRDIYTKPRFSGEELYFSQNITGNFNGTNRNSELRIYGLYKLCGETGDYLNFNLSGADIMSSTINYSLNDLILTETNATKVG